MAFLPAARSDLLDKGCEVAVSNLIATDAWRFRRIEPTADMRPMIRDGEHVTAIEDTTTGRRWLLRHSTPQLPVHEWHAFIKSVLDAH